MKHSDIWQLLAPFTMVKRDRYLRNLELAEMVADVPGDVVEAGVWRGGMSAGIALVLGESRRYHLFDSFQGLPPAQPIDGAKALAYTRRTRHNCSADESYAQEAMRSAGVSNYHLVKGWFADTMPGDEPYPNGIALLRLDGDWYESTLQVLDALFPLVNPGGVVIVDDYHYWDGCALAVHEYLARNRRYERVEQIGPHVPEGRRVAFLRKRPEEMTDA